MICREKILNWREKKGGSLSFNASLVQGRAATTGYLWGLCWQWAHHTAGRGSTRFHADNIQENKIKIGEYRHDVLYGGITTQLPVTSPPYSPCSHHPDRRAATDQSWREWSPGQGSSDWARVAKTWPKWDLLAPPPSKKMAHPTQQVEDLQQIDLFHPFVFGGLPFPSRSSGTPQIADPREHWREPGPTVPPRSSPRDDLTATGRRGSNLESIHAFVSLCGKNIHVLNHYK